jgi:LysM repeat protein
MNRHGILGTALLLSCGGLLAACAESPQTSAPAHMMGPAQGGPATGTASLGSQSSGGPTKTRYIVVQPGQSLGRIAEAYHVPKQAIIAANHLTMPYSLKAGARLAIPIAARQAGTPPVSGTKVALSAPAPANSGHAARRVSVPSRHAKVRLAEPEVIPLDDPEPAQAATSTASSPANPDSSVTTSAPRAPSRSAEPGAAAGSPAKP